MKASSQDGPVILVTGAAGFLGSYVVKTLLNEVAGCRVIAVSRKETGNRSDDTRSYNVHGDLRDERVWSRLPETITHVCHLAAAIPWSGSQKTDAEVMQDNLLPVEHLARQCRRWLNLEQIIYSSSVSVYESTGRLLTEGSPTKPSSVYGSAKLAGEERLSELNATAIAVVSLRLSSLYGYGHYPGTVLPTLIDRAEQNQELRVFGDGQRTQDFLHVSDAARAIVSALRTRARGVYNIGSGTPTTMLELAELVNKVFALGRVPIALHPELADGDLGIKLDISKAKSELNYEPAIQLEAGLKLLKQDLEKK